MIETDIFFFHGNRLIQDNFNACCFQHTRPNDTTPFFDSCPWNPISSKLSGTCKENERESFDESENESVSFLLLFSETNSSFLRNSSKFHALTMSRIDSPWVLSSQLPLTVRVLEHCYQLRLHVQVHVGTMTIKYHTVPFLGFHNHHLQLTKYHEYYLVTVHTVWELIFKN